MPGRKKKNTPRNKPKTAAKPVSKRKKPMARVPQKMSEKNKRVLGAFFLLLSVFTLVSLVSYVFTWKQDQSVVDGVAFFELLTVDSRVDNWLGKLGAFVGHTLIFKSFGFSAFLLAVIFFTTGMKVGFSIIVIPINKLIKNSLFLFVFLSLFLGYVFGQAYPVAGGYGGLLLSEFLKGFVGSVGLGFLLVFLAFSYIVVAFNPSLEVVSGIIRKWVSKSSSPSSTVPKKEVKPEENAILDKFKDVEMHEEEEEKNNQPVSPESTLSITDELEIELSPEKEEEVEEKSEEQEDELEVEVSQEDEAVDESEIAQKSSDIDDYDPKLDLSAYKLPSIELLDEHGGTSIEAQYNEEELLKYKNKIVETLSNYKIGISKIKATVGPTVTLYEIVPEAGVRISKIKNLEDDIALSLSALGIRIIAPIPGKGTIGIEVPNSNPAIVSMKSVVKSEKFQHNKMELPMVFGKTINNETFVADLAKMPHMLMAGATGQGKSVGLNAMLVSLLYKKHPSQLKFVLVDPKKVELTLYNKIERHFLAKLPDEEEAIITDTQKVVKTLNSLCVEMDERYELLKNAQVRNIKEYNTKFIKRKLNPNNGHRYLPYIVLVIDEFADLIMTAGKEVEMPIARLAQLARAIGIHLIIATQRPSVNIITGIIKANFPARIAFRVTSKIDSRTILDAGGAEQLIGRGDMLFSTGSDLTRLQCAFVDTPEVEEITGFIGDQRAYPTAFMLPEVADSSDGSGDFDDDDKDELFEDAARIVVIHQQGSASLLQRKLKLGYNRAGRIVDQLEAAGVIGPFEGSKARKVLLPDEMALEQFLSNSN